MGSESLNNGAGAVAAEVAEVVDAAVAAEVGSVAVEYAVAAASGVMAENVEFRLGSDAPRNTSAEGPQDRENTARRAAHLRANAEDVLRTLGFDEHVVFVPKAPHTAWDALLEKRQAAKANRSDGRGNERAYKDGTRGGRIN